MSPEHWQRLKALFQHAAERTPAERSAFLAGACDDVTLRRELSALLVADAEGTHELLAGPLITPPEGWLAAGDELPIFGSYRAIRRLGCGGMGTVFLAQRTGDYRQWVAVKVLHHSDAENRRRFHQERQILAGLDHPGIARLLDGGTTGDGRPYLVMEYVDGLHVDRYCRRHRLTIEERLRLFQAVCRAVGYAHHNLVVHRDLKPSNVLVTAEGTVKLLDFGIAKLLNPTLSAAEVVSTRPSLRYMSAGYASPEQVQGEPITTASDVYALGVLLYQLVTGRRPYGFTRRTPQEIVRVVCEVEPPPPSEMVCRPPPDDDARRALERIGEGRPEALRRRLSGELDAIVLTALAKAPRHRYGSVDEMMADVDRHLTHRPVRARCPRLGERLRKRLRRSPRTVALLVIIALLALAMAVQTLRLRHALAEGAAVRERLEALERSTGPSSRSR